MTDTVLLPLAGGALIGVAAGAFMVLNGRIAGISGIVGSAIESPRRPGGWRLSFLLGLIVGGGLLALLRPSAFPAPDLDGHATLMLLIAGSLVGFGTRMGGGCTSGHGVCGVARFSTRSITATVTFIATGVLTVVVSRAAGWL